MSTPAAPSSDGIWFVVFLAANIGFFAWISMLVIGAAWHVFDIGSPISFLACLPIGLGLTIAAFLAARRRGTS